MQKSLVCVYHRLTQKDQNLIHDWENAETDRASKSSGFEVRPVDRLTFLYLHHDSRKHYTNAIPADAFGLIYILYLNL